MNKLFSMFFLIVLVQFSFAQELDTTYTTCHIARQKSIKEAPIDENLARLLNTAANARSDTFDILNYNIVLDIMDYSAKRIGGYCDITFTPKLLNVNNVTLDLLKMTVDSIRMNGAALNFSYDDTLLYVGLSTALLVGDTAVMRVYYRGAPYQEPRWGGFYFSGTYSYNLGIGLSTNPHNFGKVWYPCFDSWVERATYDFTITSRLNRTAWCNGYKISETKIGVDTLVTVWHMPLAIPTYLSGVAVADYAAVSQQYVSITGDTIPIDLVSRPQDTTNFKASFINLNKAIFAFEDFFGPYIWNRVGFVSTTQGAMEHATNIAYPNFTLTGSLANEKLMAHELAHHWWGNMTTTTDYDELWLKEGFAEFSGHLFYEYAYSRAAYLSQVKNNFYDVISTAHIDDNGYRAIAGLPFDYSYGTHCYYKGAAMVHNLRAYMGDSLFKVGTRSVLNNYLFDNLTSSKLRDELNRATGLNLTDYFTDWVFNPGYSQFTVDSFVATPNGNNYNITIQIKQRVVAAPRFHQSVPLQLTLKNNNWQKFKANITANGQNTTVTVNNVPFIPDFIEVNEEGLLNLATTDYNLLSKTRGTVNMPQAKFRITTNTVTDSALVRIEHHWVAPDPIKNNVNNYRISKNHYWRISGIFSAGYNASALINYDGRRSNSYLDLDLVGTTEDSIILLYRKDATVDWQEYPDYTINPITAVSQFGTVTINNLAPGEYAFANGISVVVATDVVKLDEYKIYPNPSSGMFNLITNTVNTANCYLVVRDMQGKMLLSQALSHSNSIDLTPYDAGNYLLEVYNGSKSKLFYEQLVLVK